MPTKTEYREYIASAEWRERRKRFIEESGYDSCNRCGLPRWLAVIAYDQDLHIHHKSYALVGAELDEDLEPLCRRCHEVETFGVSQLHKPQSFECRVCGHSTWDMYEQRCSVCSILVPGGANEIIPPMVDSEMVQENLLWVLSFALSDDEILDRLIENRRRREEARLKWSLKNS